MSYKEWVPTEVAVERLTKNSDDPRALLLHLLRDGSVTARATSVLREGVEVQWAPFLKRKSYEIRSGFWKAISLADWSKGFFGLTTVAPTELFGVGEALQWSANGVELNWLEVLQQAGPIRPKAPTTGGVPANRKLDHNKITDAAIAMRAARPEISIGSTAASIVADLPPNPRNGKRRDARHIEKIIAPLWEGEVLQSPQ